MFICIYYELSEDESKRNKDTLSFLNKDNKFVACEMEKYNDFCSFNQDDEKNTYAVFCKDSSAKPFLKYSYLEYLIPMNSVKEDAAFNVILSNAVIKTNCKFITFASNHANCIRKLVYISVLIENKWGKEFEVENALYESTSFYPYPLRKTGALLFKNIDL